MSIDVNCPYCGEGQEICHDDGYGYSEDELHQQDCSCGKTFGYRTTISFYYDAEKVKCFNEDEPEHEWEFTLTAPWYCTQKVCKHCEERSRLSLDEIFELMCVKVKPTMDYGLLFDDVRSAISINLINTDSIHDTTKGLMEKFIQFHLNKELK